jgi:succinoglycan biosynthesis transport protein ExoP
VASPSEVSLRDRLGVLSRKKGTIVLVTMLTVGAALAFSFLQTPVYAATARLLLQPRTSESLFDPNASIRFDPARAVRNEIEVFKSEPVRDAVRNEIGVAPPVSVTSVGDTDVIRVTAEDVDTARAARVANAYAEQYISVRRKQALDDLQAAGREVQAKVDDLGRQIDALDRQVEAAPPADRDALKASLTQQRQALVSTQALFKQRLDQIQVETPLKSGGAQLVARATPSSDPVRPRPVRNGVLGLTLGLMAGVGLAFFRDHLDDSMKSKEDLEDAVPGLPVVGMIPLVTSPRARGGESLVVADEPSSPAAEAYRTLRTSLQFLSLDRPIRSLLVTSPNAGEGKTTTIANLGVVLARAGIPVVIVCCDLRRPRVHELFGMSNGVGFTSVLLGEVPLSSAVQPAPGVERLSVLPSGPTPPNPSELLSIRRTSEVFAGLSADGGRLVLIDAPPVLPVSDALVLSSKVDAMLLVCVSGITPGKEATRAFELLQQVDAPVVGTVLNGITSAAGYGYGYSYNYYTSSPPPSRKEATKR